MTETFEKFNSLRILVIGDVMMDTYIWGKVDRISPEAPVPVVRVSETENRLGGAANVALNVQSLGANPIICAIVGDDKEGENLIELVRKQGLSTEGILKIKNRCTTVKTRIIAHNQQIVRVDSETDDCLSADQTDRVIEQILRILSSSKIDAIVFEDYDKGLISSKLIETIVNHAQEKDILTVVDPKKLNFQNYKGVSLFKPNLKELKEGLKIEIDPSNQTQIEEAVELIKQELGAKTIMLTLSEHGVYISGNSGRHLIPAHVRDIADVSGAGDTVIATAALCLAAGFNEYETAAISNLAGGLVCEHVGVVPINKAELIKGASQLGLENSNKLALSGDVQIPKL